jgi:hypothetical protein
LNITEMTVPETLEETEVKSRVVTFRQEARPQTSIAGARRLTNSQGKFNIPLEGRPLKN